jgi:hypothetical protein
MSKKIVGKKIPPSKRLVEKCRLQRCVATQRNGTALSYRDDEPHCPFSYAPCPVKEGESIQSTCRVFSISFKNVRLRMAGVSTRSTLRLNKSCRPNKSPKYDFECSDGGMGKKSTKKSISLVAGFQSPSTAEPKTSNFFTRYGKVLRLRLAGIQGDRSFSLAPLSKRSCMLLSGNDSVESSLVSSIGMILPSSLGFFTE